MVKKTPRRGESGGKDGKGAKRPSRFNRARGTHGTLRRPGRPKGGSGTPSRRQDRVRDIQGWIERVPEDWITVVETPQEDGVQPLPCNRYSTLVQAWKKAVRWRAEMDDILSTMLAIAASTLQQGDQLFMMVVGSASGGKSQFCDGLIISKYCYQLEHLTGWFSGFKDDEGTDYSLLNRANGHCLVTSEGDVMMQNPQFQEIMSKSRRIFDGRASATYKNLAEDRFYNWIRLTWVMAGTYSMLEKDDASLGDRFLKIFFESPEEDERREILKRTGRNAWRAVKNVSQEGEDMDIPEIVEAQRMTGGYVDWLRENGEILHEINCKEHYFEECENLALLVSIMRARPARDDDAEATKEEPNRLNSQFVRLMCCMALVLNKDEIDDEVMRRVRKVAFGTGYGVVQNIIRLLYDRDEYISSKAIALHLDRGDESTRKVLRFLRRIGAIQLLQDTEQGESPPRGRTGGRKAACWGLTDYVQNLCEEVL